MKDPFKTMCDNCFNRVFCLVNGSHCASKAHELCIEYSESCRKGSQRNFVSRVTKGWTKINSKRNCTVAYQPIRDIFEVFNEKCRNSKRSSKSYKARKSLYCNK